MHFDSVGEMLAQDSNRILPVQRMCHDHLELFCLLLEGMLTAFGSGHPNNRDGGLSLWRRLARLCL